MKVLRITQLKKWFDMCDSGEKPDEYREINSYWISRLTKNWKEWDGVNLSELKFKEFDSVFSMNGYNPAINPSFKRKCLSITIGYGKQEWGAEPGKLYFIIKLGEKL